MEVGDEVAVSAEIRRGRARRGLSQAELAEAARVSAKTVQRMEAGQAVAGSSRRAVLAALGLDPLDLAGRPAADVPPAAQGWRPVADAGTLLETVAGARSVTVELDREGWRRALRERPWYRQRLSFASSDPVELILETIDRRLEGAVDHSPGSEARERDELTEAMRGAEALGWALASQVDDSGRLTLYVGSPAEVRERAKRPPPSLTSARRDA